MQSPVDFNQKYYQLNSLTALLLKSFSIFIISIFLSPYLNRLFPPVTETHQNSKECICVGGFGAVAVEFYTVSKRSFGIFGVLSVEICKYPKYYSKLQIVLFDSI